MRKIVKMFGGGLSRAHRFGGNTAAAVNPTMIQHWKEDASEETADQIEETKKIQKTFLEMSDELAINISHDFIPPGLKEEYEGNKKREFEQGQFFLYGALGFPQCNAAARYWLNKAASPMTSEQREEDAAEKFYQSYYELKACCTLSELISPFRESKENAKDAELEKSDKVAFKLLKQATDIERLIWCKLWSDLSCTDHGPRRATYFLAKHYECGQGVKADKKKALTCFASAMHRGSERGQISFVIWLLLTPDNKMAKEKNRPWMQSDNVLSLRAHCAEVIRNIIDGEDGPFRPFINDWMMKVLYSVDTQAETSEVRLELLGLMHGAMKDHPNAKGNVHCTLNTK